ncbi:uncharacterized protein Triagg1_4660 [Trichoderma aggressivum f. europaeum]|uniref:Nephrocystin 3-like N-terminal domain-containing protein n=1 Tax=Trichoderma aggressivum f. europaeum TaxID=173218 RepID=A0AAE1JAL0_9HYPO|nr:hypothetical protein Triagg1_4660 [Trichoderma aggressivum f. europaeum]
MAEPPSSRTGASIIYEPKDGEPMVDIVLVHGLQGHPFKTWTYGHGFKAETEAETARNGASDSQDQMTNSPSKGPWLQDLIRRFQGSKSQDTTKRNPKASIFWPRDLLPSDCPKARIIVLGYDTVIVKLPSSGRTNQNNIFTHGKDILNELSRTRPLGRRVIFVAHSLGGILVKEILTNCSTSNSEELQDILNSTSAVIFLGTPHRGSSVASLGAIARKAASLLLLDTNSSIVDSLALKNADLSRCQDVFSSLWAKHDFQVKSFQEGLAFKFKIRGLPFVVAKAKVVPDFSSCLGDPRERAETLHGDHREICRFDSADCPNYKKVSGEIKRIYIQLEAVVYEGEKPSVNYTASGKIERFLGFPGMQNRLRAIKNPLLNTCTWLARVKAYEDWISRKNVKVHHGLLQVVGKPGTGKSTTMKRTFEQVSSKFSEPTICVAGFFFNKRGNLLEHSQLGMFRSLLHQILRFHPQKFPALLKLREQESQEQDDDQISDEYLSSFREIFQDIFLDEQNNTRTVIFVDALDECDEPGNRDIAYFFRHLTDEAYKAGVQLDVCLSRREFPNVVLKDCPEIRVEKFTRSDIEYYISRRLEVAGFGDNQTTKQIQCEIANKADGIFLWVILVIDKIIKESANGRNKKYLLDEILRLPAQLNSLFAELLDPSKMSRAELQIVIYLFQWAVLSTSPLRLREWHHILAFIYGPQKSLAEWKDSKFYTATDQELVDQLRAISRGLVEVKMHQSTGASEVEDVKSAAAGAGSLDSSSGDSRIVQLIHESVRSFFVEGGEWLSKAWEVAGYQKNGIVSFCAEGHIALAKCCFQYLAVEELQGLSDARIRTEQTEVHRQSSPSLSSFYPKMFTEQPEAHLDNSNPFLPMSNRLSSYRPYNVVWQPSVHSRATSFGSSASSHDNRNSPYPDDREDANSFPRPLEDLELGENNQKPRDISDLISGSMNSHSSLARSKILSDYPALESYAINRVFLHARLAQDDGADPMPIIDLLHNGHYWQRWLSLQENITETNSLLSLAVEQGLDTWVDCIMRSKSIRPPSDQIDSALLSAILCCRTESIRILVAHGAQVHTEEIENALRKKKFRQTFLAALKGNHAVEETKEIVLSAVVPDYRLIFNKAIGTGDFELALDFLNFDVSVKQKLCNIPLHDFFGGRYCKPDHLSAALQFFLDKGADINERNASGESLVHLAVQSRDIKLLHALVLAGADVEARDDQTFTPLHQLIRSISDDSSSCILQQLVSCGVDATATDSQGRTPLHLIAGKVEASASIRWSKTASDESEDVFTQLFVKLIDAGADANARSSSGWTSLHHMCYEHGREAFIQDLVRAGADINAKDGAGRTPLHHSVESVRTGNLVKELIANGAIIHIEDAQHCTPIDIVLEQLEANGLHSARFHHVNTLVSAGAQIDVTRRDSRGQTLLYKAVLAGDKKLAEFLVLHGADVNEKDEEGRSALHLAFSLATNEGLISNFYVSAKTATGLTALHIAADAGIYGLIDRLVALGAGLDERDHLGRTPLYLAAAQSYTLVIRELLRSGANARIRDKAVVATAKYTQRA